MKLNRSFMLSGVAVTFWLSGGSAHAQDRDVPTEPLPGMATEVTVSDAGRVELHVEDVPLSTVLRLLSIEGRRNIVASPDVKGSVTANLYHVSFDEALTAILTANGLGYRVAGNFIYVHTLEELASMSNTGSRDTRVFSLNYISATDATAYVSQMLDEEDSVSASPQPPKGLSSSSTDGGGNGYAARDFLVVTASPEKLDTIGRVLREIDVRPQQVLIEATILRADLKDDNALGIDFTLLGGVDLELLGGASQGLQNLTLGALPQARFERFNAAASTGFSNDVGSGGLNVGVIKDHVAVFVRALEQITDTTVLANPKVLGLNKQKAQVIVGRRDGFLTTTVTQTSAVQKVDYLETGTQLIFRPFIGDDGYIRVELHPEDSVGFVNAQGLPSEQTTEITTNVLVRDGETILIGGLFREVDAASRNQVPGLGSIPGLGVLFRSNNDSVTREEVIILLTIHIVKNQARYAQASRDVLENTERIRIGARQGMMWHGRERLAHTFSRKALNAMADGDPDKALWYANLALNNNRRLVDAVKLKERILGERAWEARGSAGREFIHYIVEQERGGASPLFQGPTILDSNRPSVPPSGDHHEPDTNANPANRQPQ